MPEYTYQKINIILDLSKVIHSLNKASIGRPIARDSHAKEAILNSTST